MIIAIAVLLFLTGCTSLTINRDYFVDDKNGIIYGRTEQIVQNICLRRGAQRYAMTQFYGCYDARDDVLIIPLHTGPGNWIYDHEMKHRLEGVWH